MFTWYCRNTVYKGAHVVGNTIYVVNHVGGRLLDTLVRCCAGPVEYMSTPGDWSNILQNLHIPRDDMSQIIHDVLHRSEMYLPRRLAAQTIRDHWMVSNDVSEVWEGVGFVRVTFPSTLTLECWGSTKTLGMVTCEVEAACLDAILWSYKAYFVKNTSSVEVTGGDVLMSDLKKKKKRSTQMNACDQHDTWLG